MFKLKNRYGNINYIVKSESERDEMLSRGFVLVEEENGLPRTRGARNDNSKTPKTEGKKNGKENKAKS